MKNRKKKGISLIVLVITIIVIIILSGTIILSLSANNPIETADKAVYLSDVKNFQVELDLYKSKQFIDKLGIYDPTLLQADSYKVTYNGIVESSKIITDLIPSLNISGKYVGEFEVVNGELAYTGGDLNKKAWSQEVSIELKNAEPVINSLLSGEEIVRSGTDIVYTLIFTSNLPIISIDLENKIEIIEGNLAALSNQPKVLIDAQSDTNKDKIKKENYSAQFISNEFVQSINIEDELRGTNSKLTIPSNQQHIILETQDSINESIGDFYIEGDNNILAMISEQPDIIIGEVSGTDKDKIRTVDITIQTDTLTYGEYQVKIKSGAITNSNGITNTEDIILPGSFSIDDTKPENPTMLADPSTMTKENVLVTINYSVDSIVKEYSFDNINWYNYIEPVVVAENNTTVYARGKDVAGNESGVSSLTVANIDKIIPTVIYGTNGETAPTSASTTVTVNDLGGTGINTGTLQYVWDTQNIIIPSSGWLTFTNGQTITKTGDGIYYLWIKGNDNVGNSLVDKTNAFIIGDVVVPVSTVQTENKTFFGSTTGFSFDNPVIPAGFVAVNTDDANWNNLSTDWNKGLVIQDASSNQFVWVPVDETNVTYAKWCVTGYSYIGSYDDVLPTGFNEYNATTKYKGFYIARYESMFDYNSGNIRVASKKSLNKTSSIDWRSTRNATFDGYVWNFINYTDAKSYSQNMATMYGYDLTKVNTNLVTGTQWDAVMKWVQNSGKNISVGLLWGNHNNSGVPANVSGFGNLQISGYSKFWKANNIYDLAGNLWEWTNEGNGAERVFRGGSYNWSAYTTTAAYRNVAASGYCALNLSFRTALYVL